MSRGTSFFKRYKGDRTAKPDPLWYRTHRPHRKGKRVKCRTELRK